MGAVTCAQSEAVCGHVAWLALPQYRSSRSRCVGAYALSVLDITVSVPDLAEQARRRIRGLSTGHRVAGA
eukprot:1473146-Rhodomonas_salina.2